MTHDILAQPVSLRAEAVGHWNNLVMAFLAHGAATPVHLGKLLEVVPDYAPAHALKGLFYLLLGRCELLDTVVESQRNARDFAGLGTPLNPREMAYLGALDHAVRGSFSGAVNELETCLRLYPSDTLAMKLSHALRFVLGDGAGMRRSIERVLPHYGADHAGRGYLLGCHAFALEETGAYGAATSAGAEALSLAGDDAWGLHAVAHVHDMTADAQGGLAWLEGREAAWAQCNNFRFHVWWHKALMHLELRQFDLVLDLYDREVRAERTDDYRDISNATSLLTRLELEGIDVGDRWEELAALSEGRTEDGCLIFADLHYLLALTTTGKAEATARMIARLRADATRAQTEAEARMARPGLAAAAGLEAFGEGDYAGAFVNLARARPYMQDAGGSHAQRDVFERLTIDAGLRAGLWEAAEAILHDRTARRGGHEDQYAASRHEMIAASARAPRGGTVAAE